MEVVRPLLDWLVEHTYLVVFVGTLIDASGLPFPGRLLLAGAGALAANGQAHVVLVIALAALGAMLVDHAWFLTITRGSTRLASLYRRLTRRSAELAPEDAEYVRRYAGATIVLGRFFTVVRVFGWPLAATHGVGLGRFAVLDVCGTTLWASLWVLLGWVVGDRWESSAHTIGAWASTIGVLLLVGLGGPVALRVWRRRARASL